MSRNGRIAVLAAAAIAIVVALLVAGSGSKSHPKYSGVATVTVAGAKPQGGVSQLIYKRGQTVDLTVVSDTADEIHIHGYDLHKDLPAHGSVRFAFPASIDGQFVIELENHKQQIASLRVEP